MTIFLRHLLYKETKYFEKMDSRNVGNLLTYSGWVGYFLALRRSDIQFFCHSETENLWPIENAHRAIKNYNYRFEIRLQWMCAIAQKENAGDFDTFTEQ